MSIFCPVCAWRPRSTSRWVCRPHCGTVWNTFDTHGRCPGCNRQWRETCCLSCQGWSPHDDWYHDDLTDAAGGSIEEQVRRLLEEPERVPV